MIKDTLNKLISNRNTELAACKDELEKLSARISELEKINDESNDEEELKAAGEELDALKAKKAELEAEIQGKQAELDEINAQLAELDKPGEGEEMPQRKKLNFMTNEMRGANKMTREEMETRAKAFASSGKMTITNEETRAMLVSSGKIATPTGVQGINELDNQVSSIIDMVDVVNCEGMGSNKIAYEFTAPTGGITVEGAAYQAGETVTDFVTTTPKTVTIITQISKQVTKQSPLDYEAKVKKNALIALRKKVSNIVIAAIKASTLKVEKTLTKLDEKTLRNVALAYGGDENVTGNAVLLLNKNTLVALGDVRGANEKKAVYEITPNASNPNTGIIKDGGLAVEYILNSNVADNELIYGQAKKFELDLYSNYEIKVSEDFAFDKGMLTIRGDVELDGAVAFKDGFIVATVSA